MARHPIRPADEVLTIEAYERLPDDERSRDELVRGRVVREPRPGYEHGRVATQLAWLLRQFAGERGLGEVVADAGFVLFEDPPTVRGPDVAFIAAARVPAGITLHFARMAPDLVVEVVSPSNSLAEIRERVTDYLEAGTRRVWVVDPGRRAITIHGSDEPARVLGPAETLDGGDVLPGFRVPVAEVFAR